MIDPAVIKEHLIVRMKPIFGELKDPDGYALVVARYAPDYVTGSQLERLADGWIETRKAKGFPTSGEVIAAVKSLPHPASQAGHLVFTTQKDKDGEDAERRARNFMRGTEAATGIARKAVEGRWAPGLYWFVVQHGRAPSHDEELEIITLSRKLDAAAKDVPVYGAALAKLRSQMHERAERELVG